MKTIVSVSSLFYCLGCIVLFFGRWKLKTFVAKGGKQSPSGRVPTVATAI